MSDPSNSIMPPVSRRRFAVQMAATGGAAVLTALCPASGQDADARAALDESLKGRLIFWASPGTDPENTGVFAYDLVTRKWPRLLDGVKPEWFCRASPDGKSFALAEGSPPRPRVWIIRPDGRTSVSQLPGRVFWSPDGREVILSEWVTRPFATKTWRIRNDGAGRVRLPVPDDEMLNDWSSDGNRLLVFRLNKDKSQGMFLTRRAVGTAPSPLIEENLTGLGPGRFSPDGRWVAYTGEEPELNRRSLWVIEVAARLVRRVWKGNADGDPDGIPCWSPDGKYIAVGVADLTTNTRNEVTRIEVVDLQGHRIRQLGIPHKHPVLCDWR